MALSSPWCRRGAARLRRRHDRRLHLLRGRALLQHGRLRVSSRSDQCSRRGGEAPVGPWRWWSYEPQRLDWLSAFALFVGTLAFGVSLSHSFLSGLTAHEVNRQIWTPEIIGCVFFLVSGHLGFVQLCHRARPCLRRRNLDGWIVAINQLGSILFLLSAIAAFTRPVTGSEINVVIANWGTLTGALCFAVGGVAQAFERPGTG